MLKETGQIGSDLDIKALENSENHQDGSPQLGLVDRSLEKKLLLKLDFLLLPVLTGLFFFIGLERLALANAKTVGIDVDLGLVGNQYYLIVMLGYLPLCPSGAPGAMSPQFISLIMLIYGILGICTAFAKSFGGLLTIRLLLGLVEGPLMPLVIAYLSQFYARGELSLRLGIWYSAIPFSGCLAGIISFGVFKIQSDLLKGWQILFLIVGSICTAFSIFAYIYLPASPFTWNFLSEDEKALLRSRLLMDGTHDVEEVISWRDAYLPFIQDWRYLVWALLAFGMGVPLASAMNYIPQLTARLGYGPQTTNLLTAGPFLLNLILSIALSYSSDYFRERSFHLAFPLTITSIGFILITLIPISSRSWGYFATFLICAGTTCPSPLLSVWYSNNTISQTHRIILAAVMVAIANSAGLVSGNIYMAKEEERGYPTATITTATIGGMTALGVVLFGIYMRYENRRRNQRDGKPKCWGSKDVPTILLQNGHRAKEFRYMN